MCVLFLLPLIQIRVLINPGGEEGGGRYVRPFSFRMAVEGGGDGGRDWDRDRD